MPELRSIFPIGQFGGATGHADDPATRFRVRLGEGSHDLTMVNFTAWAHAHGTPDHLDHVTRATVTAPLAAGGMANAIADGVVSELVTSGLLAEVDRTSAVAFANRHRLTPLLLGLGNTMAEPGRYELGLFDQPVLVVPRLLCTVWERADRMPDLWTACRWISPIEGIEATKVLEMVLTTMHGLLAVNAAYLDLADPRRVSP